MRVAIARDSAFGFYYPDADALFIGGGFPETHMQELEANGALRASIRDAVEAGLPAYVECGGLMYLARSLIWQGQRAEMAGVIEADVVMHGKPQGRGYVRLRETAACPWSAAADGAAETTNGGEIPAHEFHYSSLENLGGTPVFAFDVLRGAGIDGRHDGLVQHNLMANFAHLRDTAAHRWARRFIAFAAACKHAEPRLHAG